MFRRLLILLLTSFPIMANDALFLQKAVEVHSPLLSPLLLHAMKLKAADSDGFRGGLQFTWPENSKQKAPQTGPTGHSKEKEQEQEETACEDDAKTSERKSEKQEVDFCDLLESVRAELMGLLRNTEEYRRDIQELRDLYAFGRQIADLSTGQLANLLFPSAVSSMSKQGLTHQHNIQVLEAVGAVESALQEECPDMDLSSLSQETVGKDTTPAGELIKVIKMKYKRGTALCWYYLHRGRCNRSQCWFSHSLREVREQQPKYKMEYCGREQKKKCNYRNCYYMHIGEVHLIKRTCRQEGIPFIPPRAPRTWAVKL